MCYIWAIVKSSTNSWYMSMSGKRKVVSFTHNVLLNFVRRGIRRELFNRGGGGVEYKLNRACWFCQRMMRYFSARASSWLNHDKSLEIYHSHLRGIIWRVRVHCFGNLILYCPFIYLFCLALSDPLVFYFLPVLHFLHFFPL